MRLERMTLDNDTDSVIKPLNLLSRECHMLLQHISDFSAQLQFLQKAHGKYMRISGIQEMADQLILRQKQMNRSRCSSLDATSTGATLLPKSPTNPT